MGLTVYRYHQFLGKIIKGKTSIGVSGAHGKTSTTGLLAHVLSGIAPTDYLIGDGSGKGVPNARFLFTKPMNIVVTSWQLNLIMPL